MTTDGDPNRFLVLIESGSNQSWIFQSTRRKFQVGASAIIKRLPDWVEVAIDTQPTDAVDVLVSTSSKVVLLVDSPKTGQQVIQAVTERCLVEAPGLDVWGVVEDPGQIHLTAPERLSALQARHGSWRWCRVNPQLRSPMGPFLQQCAATALAAITLTTSPDAPNAAPSVPISDTTKRAFDAARDARESWQTQYGLPDGALLAKPDDEISNDGWVAVIHADGNGVGDILDRISSFDQYRTFSNALEEATAAAFTEAAEATHARAQSAATPISGWLIPLVLGGDDLTVVCDARLAIPFVRAYLRAFEVKTSDERLLIDDELSRVGHLTASAGVAVVKPHYPFHSAYELVEELASSAKQIKQYSPSASAYDLHVLHDSISRPLDQIRNSKAGRLVCAPLVPTDTVSLPEDCTIAEHYEWNHRDHDLLAAAESLAQDDETNASNKAIHEMRTAGLESEAALERTLQRLAVTNPGIQTLVDEVLYREDDEGGIIAVMSLLDLIDLATVPDQEVSQ